jgi:hypothetical protein
MNESQIRAELEAVKAALREGTGDLADLQARARHASSSLAVLLGEGEERMTRLRERNVRGLIALWTEVQTALAARGAG